MLRDSIPARSSRSRVHVLVVEDNPGDAELIAERLWSARETISVTVVATLAEALRSLSTLAFDALILDLNLPDSMGLATIQRVREVTPPTVPIVVLAGGTDPSLREAALGCGATDVMDKDESPDGLFTRSVLYAIERLRAEARESQLETLVDEHPDAILVVGADGVVRFANQAALDVLGRTRSELVGAPAGFSVKEGERNEIRAWRGGEERIGEMEVASVDWRGERALIASIRDVTLRAQAEHLRARSQDLETENRRMEAANRLKSEFLANMSHELRTPLNAINGFAELLYDGLVSPRSPQYREFLGHILTSGKHLLRVINDILDLAKVEAGKLEFHPEAVDVGALASEVCAVLSTAAGAKSIAIALRVDPELGVVEIDPARFRQVLYNFLSNAIKFTGAGGHVEVRVESSSTDTFRLEVQDDGIGIASESLERLFVEFEQLHSGADKAHPGSGLGLALTRRLAEAQGGRVMATSKLGEGSTFSVTFPRRAPFASPSARPPAFGSLDYPVSEPRGVPSPTRGSKTILVVDDDATSIRVMEAALRQLGFAPSSARSATSALRAIERIEPVAIVLDLVMPEMDGFEFLERVRALPRHRHTPIVLWTVKTLSHEELVLVRRSACSVVSKGAAGKSLLTELRAYLLEGAAVIT
jgi:signal transduction histidine kinase/response regulator of citrate/malate metabolism